jgi:peptide/nickel transport system substrate-binding protein
VKKYIVLLSTVLLSISLTACGGGQTPAGNEGASSGEAILYHAYASQPYVTLDPRSENSNGVMVLHNVYETLTHYNDKTGEAEPLLATDWSVSEDGAVWVFNLREDVVFHDGSKMTAENVAKSIMKTKEIGMGAAYIWDSISNVEATGEYEVTFTCEFASPVDLIASAAYASYIISDSAVDQSTEWFNAGNDGGTGPYTIAQASGDTCVLKAFDEYREGWKDNQYRNVIIKESPESNVRRQLLETGEAQITTLLSSTDEAALREMTDKVTVVSFDSFTNVVIMLNHESAPTDNADFRKALAYAFPYEDTINNVMEGNAVASHGLVTAGLWGHDDSLEAYTCDLEKAKEYLDRSGVDTSNITLKITYATGMSEYDSWGQLYQVNLKQLGIQLELSPMEWDNQWDMAKATNPDDRQDMFVFMWWPDYASPESWFTSLVRGSDEIYFNLGYVNDENYDALIQDAIENVSTDRDKAAGDYIEVQRQIIENADIMTLYDKINTYIVSNSVSGVYENPAYPSCVNYYNVTIN